MKVKDLIGQDICGDVYDIISIGIAIFFEPKDLELTDDGKKEFDDVLNYDVKLQLRGGSLTIWIDVGRGDGWEDRVDKAERFFWAVAGYCDDSDYVKWFGE